MNINPWKYTDCKSHLRMNNPFIVFSIVIHYFGDWPASGAILRWSIRIVSNYPLVPQFLKDRERTPGNHMT